MPLKVDVSFCLANLLQVNKWEKRHTCTTSSELHIAALHAVEIISLLAFFAFFNHAIPMCQLPTKNVGEDLGIAMGMCWEPLSCVDSVLIQDSQTAKVLIFRVVVIGEAEGVVGIEPSVVGMASIPRTSGNDLCV